MRYVSMVAVVMVAGFPALAGPLDPPAGPIAPTHKTLTQVEPRTPIGPGTTPGDADSTFRISQPGSYYLTANLTGESGKRGIEIAASGVTIDLCGFAMTGVTGALAAIDDVGAFTSVVVRNGTIAFWPTGGVTLTGSRNCLICDLAVNGCAGVSIDVQFNSIIRNCSVDDTAGLPGTVCAIRAQCCTVIESCHASGTGAADGIVVSDGCTVTNCVVNNVGGAGIRATNVNNIIDGCVVEFATAGGIIVTQNTTVRNCSVTFISGASGIQAAGSDNRIERNIVRQCQRGFHATAAGNIFLANTANDNTTNFDIAAGNVGLFVNAATIAGFAGSAGGVSPGSTDANTNYSY